ncbi:uncharacterized protein RHOBADRAFT_49357 [Rhodotorula graminis WP1]|uniref:Uncharacterized protein n=1 Tax=Rhodotorula graminis (strain WP1) TaxID=578459 RepID=A0A194S8C8_RHOGW|nr:uncharacterized protein RHOBADRAFT_49357 [Rhodotorula graminis WP1]KPV76847.1 hypothetical protein RHOBADRAFT_49357 [Rhodotorula graminis WP1]
MVKAALSSAFSLIPSALRPATLSAQLPMSDKSAPRHDIPRSPSPTFEFDERSGGLRGGGMGEGSSSGFSSVAAASGAKARPQPLLRTSTSAVDMRRPSTASHPGSPVDRSVGSPGLGVSPVSSYFPSSAPLPSPSTSLPQQQRRFFPQHPGGGSQPSSPAGSRFPSLSASLGPSSSAAHAPTSPVSSTSARFPLSASLGPSSASPTAPSRGTFPPLAPPGMVRRNTTDRPAPAVSSMSSPPLSTSGLSPSSSAFAQVGALGGENGRRSSEAVTRSGSGGGGAPQIRRRGTVDGYGLG